MTLASHNATPYEELTSRLHEIQTLHSIQATLGWDQETMMPPRGAPARSEQLSMIAALVHERRTDPRMGELIARCELDESIVSDPAKRANLRELRRDYERATKLPTSLVRELTQTGSLSMNAWKDARERSDYPAFAPWLEKVVELNRQKAACLTGSAEPAARYDALLDEYEPDARSADIERVFGELRGELVPLIQSIADSGRQPDDAPLRTPAPIAGQEALGRFVLQRIGFDLEAGRLDTSTHPFCEGAAAGDTRLTTRYTECGFPDALSSTMHEAGHGLYEQGLPKAEYPGQPLSDSVSFGIHESQSRMWENMVGRSLEFWEWLLPEAKRLLGASVADFSPDDLYRVVNRVQPGLIRVDADEATYNLHIMLRFDLERALLAGDLSVAELPAAWNERVRQDLGLEVPDDRRGCLQDIHWSMTAIGYFPTYTLGNLYSAQLWETIRAEIGDVHEQFRRGEFAALLGWLREKVHTHGRRFTAAELCERATGRPLSAKPLVDYLHAKAQAIYAV
jgi:carboxypeptidase Taq